ncbi:undecaprenyl-diphosphate phosphatase [Pontiella agarivorans]|uniref:Undecaprenyl-diphosphatase n=1 Tax=Pontiella agarivorans TaxID=3038953 RepID=A0ABU5MSH9_9BACT|nr:undecaprenyl-diphosphate phosphatase [Pontiella agarivorans]MDZ8117092.1 undecaprenyl-diphosphate phosphatase [Pontiella agarivorans]
MENFLKVILLAVIQGVTEFLPVSSSGHLVLSKYFLGLDASGGASLEIVLHAGTLISILAFYRKHLAEVITGVLKGRRESIRFVLLILLGCIPAIIVGFSLKDQLEAAFAHPVYVSCALIATGLFLIASHFPKAGNKKVGWISGLIIGIAQACAMMPGISRSGSTIGMSRFLGIEPKEAAEYSFLMSAPLLAGVSLLYLLDCCKEGNSSGSSVVELVVGFAVSAVVGYFSLKWLVSLLQRGRFWRFGIYCLSVGLITLVLFLV